MKWLTFALTLAASVTLLTANVQAECHSCQGGNAYADVHYGGHYGYGNHTYGHGCGDYRSAHSAGLWDGYCCKQKPVCKSHCGCHGKAFLGHGPFSRGHDLCCDGCGFGLGLASCGLRKFGRCCSKFDACLPSCGKGCGPRPVCCPRPCCKSAPCCKPRCGQFHLPKIRFPLLHGCRSKCCTPKCCPPKCGSTYGGTIVKGGAMYGSPVYGHGVVSGSERVVDSSQVPTPAVPEEGVVEPADAAEPTPVEEVPTPPTGSEDDIMPMNLPLELQTEGNTDPTA